MTEGIEYSFQPIPTWSSAVLRSQLGPRTKLVLIALSKCTSELSGVTWTTAQELATLTGLSKEDVSKAMGIAQKKGWVRWIRESKEGKLTKRVLRPTTPIGTFLIESVKPLEADQEPPEHFKTESWDQAMEVFKDTMKKGKSD